MDDPRLVPFVAAVERINRLADEAPGFVWRYPDAHRQLLEPEGSASATTVVNLSLWESYDTLHAFVYRSAHGHLVRRSPEWFMPTAGPTTALWWSDVGERPTPAAALTRLSYLRDYGPTARAFSVRRRYDAQGRPELPVTRSSAVAGPRHPRSRR